MQQLLSTCFVRRVSSYELRQLHFEYPEDFKTVEYSIEPISLRTSSIVEDIEQEFQ
jgi:hypothetical protein